MEISTDDVDRSHVLIGDGDASWIGVGVKFAVDLETGVGGGDADQVDDELTSGFARQFIVMNENRRCSILFHIRHQTAPHFDPVRSIDLLVQFNGGLQLCLGGWARCRDEFLV